MANMQKLQEQMENGELRVLKEDDTFEFDCKMCGGCCTDRSDITISPYDMFKIAKYLNIKSEIVLDKYCEVILGSNSKMPIVTLKFKEIQKGAKITVCPFLTTLPNRKLGCAIHQAKPLVCSIYPLGRMTKIHQGEKEIDYFLQEVDCVGRINPKKHILKDWLKDFNVKIAELNSSNFTDFIMELHEKINLISLYENKIVTQNTKEMLYNAFITILYCDLETDKVAIDVLSERYIRVMEIFETMKKMSNSIGIEW